MNSPGSLSEFLSFCSLSCWIFTLTPQILRNYRTKSVSKLSIYLLIFLWFGDFLNFTGCILTYQMAFQKVISSYSLCIDTLLFFQYWYYGTYLKKPLISDDDLDEDLDEEEEMMERSIGSLNSHILATSGLLLTSQISNVSAMPIHSTINIIPFSETSMDIGRIISYACACCYIGARIPQLFKNYRYKTTKGLSPYFSGLAIGGCFFYSSSILTSNQFLHEPDSAKRWFFFKNEFPFLLSNFGSILLDIVFFCQFFIYGDHKNEEEETNETTALLD